MIIEKICQYKYKPTQKVHKKKSVSMRKSSWLLELFKKNCPCVYYPLCNTQTVVKILSVKLSETLKVFQQLCVENDEDFAKLCLHNEVRWLLRGNCLKLFRYTKKYITII